MEDRFSGRPASSRVRPHLPVPYTWGVCAPYTHTHEREREESHTLVEESFYFLGALKTCPQCPQVLNSTLVTCRDVPAIEWGETCGKFTC